MDQPYSDQEEASAVWRLFNRSLEAQREVEPTPSILIVDDEPRLRDSLSELIALSGYTCASADSGQAAMDALAAGNHAVMLLDIHMPGLGGHEVLRQIRHSRHDTSVIIVSGDASWNAATSTLRQGAEDFIRKPYSPDEVLNAIRTALEKRRLRAEKEYLVEQQRLSEQLHRFLVDQSPDLIFILDEIGRFQFTNSQFRTLLGYSAPHLQRLTLNELLSEPCPALLPDLCATACNASAIRNVELNIFKKAEDANASGPAESIAVELSAERICAPPDAQGRSKLLGIYGVARDISKRKQAEALINYQAYHDLLTGLPNRALFNDRLKQVIKQAQREHRLLGIMFLDLDRFKLVNDTLGHTLGDRLLQDVAERISNCIRKADTLSRIGGDEFLLLLPQINDRHDIEHVAGKILETLQAPFTLDEHELFVRASIGIVIYPQHGETPDLLIKRADMAMYEVKNSGRGTYHFYSPALDAKYEHKLSLEHGLRKALELDQFELLYQPLVQISNQQLLSLEALIRWHHPQRGLLKPDAFIAEAEENGLIIEIGRWVIDQVMRDLRDWLDAGRRPVPVSINVSAVQLEHPAFVEQIGEGLRRHDLPGHLLRLELTENVLMKSMHSVIAKLQELCELGVKIAIDDFGTGYSSLSYLKSLPIHILKVDQSFLAEIAQQPQSVDSIVSAIAIMARGLGLELVAEGVEHENQAKYLMDIGYDCAQGFLFSEPLHHPDATRVLERMSLSA